MKKRITALVLVLVLLCAVLSGCSGKTATTEVPAETSSESSAAAETTVTEAETAETAESTETAEPAEAPEESEEPVPEDNLLALPLDETTTITIWDVFPPPLQGFMEGPFEAAANAVLEEACNIKLDYIVNSTETASEMFNLMVVAGDYCDFIYGVNQYYTSGVDMAVEDEVIIDLKDLAETIPNFVRLRNEFPDAVELSTEGHLTYFPQIVVERFNERVAGPATRGDWIDALGIDLPETYDEFYDMLKAFQTEFGAKGGYLLQADGFSGDLAVGYGVSNGFYQVDGVVKYGPMEEGYKKYCEFVHKLYSESLVPQNFYTMQGSPASSITSTETTCWSGDSGMWSFFTSGIASDDYYTVGFHPPMEKEGDVSHFNSESTGASSEGLSISTDCEQLDVMAAVVNYMYSDEFAIPANYGIEGEGFNYGEDGKPHLTELVTANPDAIMSFSVMKYTTMTAFPIQSYQTRYKDAYGEVQLNTIELWSSFGDDAYVYPSDIKLSAQDSEATSTILTDIDTAIDEYLLGFITGSISLDKYDEFQQNLLDLGIEDVIEVYQSYYDDYVAANS